MPPYTDALERALGEIVARATGKLDVLKAQADAAVAAANSRVAEAETKLLAIDTKIAERLAELKDGEPGQDGVDGDPGRDGLDGKDGSDGPPGRDGADGLDGKDGADGQGISDIELAVDDDVFELSFVRGEVTQTFQVPLVHGKDGVPGRDGKDGQEGPPGKLDAAKAWIAGSVHYEREVRTHRGSTYQALRDTGNEPPHEDWLLLAAAGTDGVDGRSFSIAETWQPDKEYSALDVVALNGGSFVARKDSPGPCPGEDWQVLAQRGKAGPPGERGAPGAKGDRGEAGPPVVALTVNDEGLLSLTNGDGSTVTCDLYPLLSRIAGR